MDPGGDDDGQKTVFPWRRLITVARYTVVSVVTVVAIAVIVKALSMVLRPKDIHLVVVGGSVLVNRFTVKQPQSVNFRFTIRAYNPTGLRITYSDMIGGFVDESDKEPFGMFIDFYFPDIDLLPQRMVELKAVVHGSPNSMDYSDVLFDVFYDENSINMALQLLGNLTTHHPSGRNTTAFYAFYCWPITVGYNPGSGDDVSCVRDKELTSYHE